MGSTIGTLVILIAIVWQIVSAVIAASKKKELEQQRRAGGTRVQRVSGQPQQRGGQASLGSPGQTGVSAEDLAAHRRAQLEELRLRRQSRANPAAPQARPPQAAPVPPQPAGVAPARRRAEVERQRAQADAKQLRGEHDEARRLQVRDHWQRESAQRQEPVVRQPHYAEEHDSVHRIVSDAGQAAEAESTLRGKATAVHRSRIQRRLSNRQQLRDLFILKELLDPPIAMRDGPDVI